MEDLSKYISTGVISLVVGVLSKYLEPKSRLVYWSPHHFFFDLKDPKIVLQTDSLTIQNIGRKSAEDVEIMHKARPDFFQFSPSIQFEESINASNEEHVIRIKNIGPKETITLQVLSYKSVPVLLNLRSKDGPAAFMQVQFQRVFSIWVNILVAIVLITGFGFSLYWLIKAIIFISKNIGVL